MRNFIKWIFKITGLRDSIIQKEINFYDHIDLIIMMRRIDGTYSEEFANRMSSVYQNTIRRLKKLQYDDNINISTFRFIISLLFLIFAITAILTGIISLFKN